MLGLCRIDRCLCCSYRIKYLIVLLDIAETCFNLVLGRILINAANGVMGIEGGWLVV